MKSMIKKIFWGFFIAWNIFVLYVISGKQEPKNQSAQTAASQQVAPETQPVIAKPIAKKETITRFETQNAIFDFVNDKLCNVELKKYKEHNGNDNKKIVNNEAIAIVWSGTAKPDENAIWAIKKQNDTLTMQHINKSGITFIQNWKYDDEYGIEIATQVINNSNHAVTTQVALSAQKNQFEQHQSFIFSGVSLCADKKIQNIAPSKIEAQGKNAKSGWTAFNEKYWLVATISADASQFSAQKITNTSVNNDASKADNKTEKYEIRAINNQQQVEAHDRTSTQFNLFIGPKDLNVLKKYSQKINKDGNTIGIENTIDYGWLFFLTKPVNYILDLLIQHLGVILALILFSIILKAMTWPMTTSSHVSARRLRDINPQLQEIRTRLKGSPQILHAETSRLYKQHGINPISGCLPSVLQLLLLFPLYKVLSFSISLYGASFPFWIKDLSLPDPTSFANLFGLLSFTPPAFLHVGAWPIIMGITMIVQQKLSSTPVPDEQKLLFTLMPIFFTWLMSSFPAGVLIYWTLMNVLTILQIIFIDYREKRRAR